METLWYQKGLKFHCTGCGKCCTGSPGYVYLSSKDLQDLAGHFQLSIEEFCKRYTRIIDGIPALLDRAGSEDCVFLKENRCSVYEARPIQCRTFPWWVHNLRTPAAWEEAAQRCEGIDHESAPLVPLQAIEKQKDSYLENLIAQNFSI